ncbi:MAG: outer membrane protein assembly factor BamD [Gammaproteobacteria bacterium]|nr:outer membrane protein assembly factor BamD [Gammaproteobacteria bacterium]
MPKRLIVSQGRARSGPARTALLLACVLAVSAAGCASVDTRQGSAAPGASDRDMEREAAALQQQARDALSAGRADEAVGILQRLEALYPVEPRIVTARMETVYAHHLADDPASAVAAAERFIRLYPDHANLDYIYYLRALAGFSRAGTDLRSATEMEGGEPVVRPPSVEIALEYFGELLARFPNSRYAEDARKRVEHLRLQLAQIELNAAKRFLNDGQYANAGLRARALIDNHPDSGLVPDAVVVLNMAHRMLRLDGDPADAAGRDDAAKAGTAGAGPAPVAGNADGLHDRAWIAAQGPGTYTIQLFSTSNEEALRGFARRHRIADLAWFRTGSGEQAWYSLIHGAFASLDEARTAAERLPAALRPEKPWIRKMSDVQALLD